MRWINSMSNGVQEVRGLMRKKFQNLRGPLFEELFVTSWEYIYDFICGLYAYDQRK